VSENGAQCLRMGEQMFMTLRDQGDPLSSQTHWSKRWTASFPENRHFTISEVYEQCPEVFRTVVYEIVTEHLQYRKLFFTLGQAAFWYEEGIINWCHDTTSCSMSKVTMWRSRWRCVIKPAYSVPFLLSINIFVW